MERNILNTQQKVASKEAIESDKTKLAEENDRLLKLTEERIALERKLSTLINSDVDISKLSLNDNDSKISVSDLMAAYETIVDLRMPCLPVGSIIIKRPWRCLASIVIILWLIRI